MNRTQTLAANPRLKNTAHTVALIGILAAVASIVRIATAGIAGVEAVFIVIIIGGRVLGARAGFVLGIAAIAVSSTLTGGFGPWTIFQLLGVAGVGFGAGLLPHRWAGRELRGWREITLLSVYGVFAAYLFGAFMNLWFWPFLVGADTSLSFSPGASLGENVLRFLVFTCVSSTLTWDTVRAVTTVVGIVLVGRFMLEALRRRAAH